MGSMDRRDPRWVRVSQATLEADGNTCQCCGNPNKFGVHHIVPVSDGGDETDPGNLITLCKSCENQVHEDCLNMTGSSVSVCGGPYLSIAAVYNIALLREMRMTGRTRDPDASFRDDFMARRARPPKSSGVPGRLSSPSLALCRLLDGGVDNVDLPRVVRFGGFEVEVRRAQDIEEQSRVEPGSA